MLTKQNQKGFTLVELIIVIAIIAVLASLAFMALSGETAQARDSKRVSDLKTFEDSVATSNGKNKKIDYATDNVGKKSNGGSRTATTTDELETSSGILQAIRGASLIPVTNDMLDSDVLPNVATDPRGSSYFAAFLSTTDYSFFATAENPDTKTATAIVRGTFKEGAIIDVLTGGVSSSATSLSVANPTRFVRGDVIKIDDEIMTVVGYTSSGATKTVTVDRGFTIDTSTTPDTLTASAGNVSLHNHGTSIKILYPASESDGLVCVGTSTGNIVTTSTGVMSVTAPALTALGAKAGTADDADVAGNVCKSASSSHPIVEDGLYLPYKVAT